MQFLILATDATDPDALSRRMGARAAHIAHIDAARAAGRAKMGVAVLNDEGQMCGSCIVAEFSSRAELDAWVASDPYSVQQVWDKIHIQQCKIGPSFQL